MKSDEGIDAAALLTMLGLVAAVWAVVPATTRLSFRLSLSALDWIIIAFLVGTIHYLYLQPVLEARGWYLSLGPWQWGFDKAIAQYLLFLALAVYICFRAQRTRLNVRHLPLFERLAISYLHARRFDDLADLLEKHLEQALRFAESTTWRGRLASGIRPKAFPWRVEFNKESGTFTFPSEPAPSLLRSFRARVADLVGHSSAAMDRTRGSLRILLASRELVYHFALTRPYMCLKLMDKVGHYSEHFQDHFFEALLSSLDSILFVELANSQNLDMSSGSHRVQLLEENRLVTFFLKDVKTAARLGVYRSVGEAVLARIDSDAVLVERLNGPLLSYQEVGRLRCPIYSGIYFFRMMVLEGLHQRKRDHLWLHYLPHFAKRLASRTRDLQPQDNDLEFPTPMSYLFYVLVDTSVCWVVEAASMPDEADAKDTPAPVGDLHRLIKGESPAQPDSRYGRLYIAYEAAKAVGGVLEPVVNSERVTHRLKSELLSVVLHAMENLAPHRHLEALRTELINSVLDPFGFAGGRTYLQALSVLWEDQDHVLRAQVPDFEAALRDALHRKRFSE